MLIIVRQEKLLVSFGGKRDLKTAKKLREKLAVSLKSYAIT